MREGQGLAVGVLESLGVSGDALRAETGRVLGGELPAVAPRATGERRSARQPLADSASLRLTLAARVIEEQARLAETAGQEERVAAASADR